MPDRWQLLRVPYGGYYLQFISASFGSLNVRAFLASVRARSHRRERSEAVDRAAYALQARAHIRQDRCCVFPRTRSHVPRQVPEEGSRS